MKRPPFDAVTLLVHWTTVVLVTALFVVAWMMTQAPDGESEKQLLTVHRSIGAAVWMLTAARLAWRSTGMRFPPFPASMPKVHQWAAKASEYGLYGLLLVQPLSGLAQTLWRGKAFDLWFWRVPALVARDKTLVHGFHAVHEWGAWALAGLIGLHAGAALLHALVLRDGVFESMWPFGRNRQGG